MVFIVCFFCNFRTCERFENLVKDRRLWKSFDFSKKKLTANEINKLLKYLTKETKEFSVRGLVSKYPNNKWKNNTLTANILSQLSTKCPLLETLAVYEGFLNFQDVIYHYIYYWDYLNKTKTNLFIILDKYIEFSPLVKTFNTKCM